MDEASLRAEANLPVTGFRGTDSGGFLSFVNICSSSSSGSSVDEDSKVDIHTPAARSSAPEQPKQSYACGSCKQPLFHSGNLVPHGFVPRAIVVTEGAVPYPGSRSTKALKFARKQATVKQLGTSDFTASLFAAEGESSGRCGQYYVEPLAWMSDTPGAPCEPSGRITCPNPYCGQKLGRYSWTGNSCPCGVESCMPAFMILRSKVIRRPYVAPTGEERSSSVTRKDLQPSKGSKGSKDSSPVAVSCMFSPRRAGSSHKRSGDKRSSNVDGGKAKSSSS